MDSEKRQITIRIVPLPEDGGAPASGVCLEIAGEAEDFFKGLESWKNELSSHPYPYEIRRYLPRRQCRISDGTGEDLTVPCADDAALAPLICACAVPGVTVREIRYRDAVYTGVSDPEILSRELQSIHGNQNLLETSIARCSAMRNGRPVTVYFLPPDSLSCGIVEADEKRQYAGAYLQRLDHNEEEYDEESCCLVPNYYVYDTPCHIFLETDGEGPAFRLLLNGVLYPLITRTEDAVIFHGITDADKVLAAGVPEKILRPMSDVIFRNEDGAYRYTVENRGIEKSRYTGVVFTPPEPADPDSLTVESAAGLYSDYANALNSAFAEAETYETDGTVFRNTGSRGCRFSAGAGDFALTVRWRPPKAFPVYLWRFVGFCWCGFENCAGMDVLTASFSVGETEVSLLPGGGSSLGINIKSPDRKDLYRTHLKELRERDSFPGEGLPETLKFDKDASSFLENLALYEAVRDALLRFGVHKLTVDSSRLEQISREEMQSLLFGGLVPDQSIVSLALELKNAFNRTGEIPNIALMGEAGTGKTRLVRALGKAVFHKEVREFSPSDLKAPYEGQTKYEVLNNLVRAAEENAIFFVDEAYELMSDEFGREAVSLLLPLMTGRTKVDASMGSGGSHKELSVDFETGAINGGARYIKPGLPPIWIAGYEDEVRLMLNQNKGLFRRLEQVLLAPPAKDQLYGKLLGELEHQRGNVDFKKYDILKKQFRDQKALLDRFFMWGAQPQNSPYFANYAGVERFLGRCLDGIDFDSAEENGITGQMETIIASVKRNVNRQLDTVRRKGGNGGGGAAARPDDAERIQMISDIETRFADLVGCENQIEYMQSIINMLADKSRYSGCQITVPKGALLLGPPGVGKTFIARAMAGELQERFEAGSETSNKRVGFMSLSAPELISKDVSFIGSVFDRAEEYDVCVIFIDEVDAIAQNRFQNDHYSHFIELIKQMDGVEQRSNVFLLAATNAYESLDPAFTRSGRIDKKLFFDLPDPKARLILAEKSIRRRCGALAGFGVPGSKKDGPTLSPKEEKGVRRLAEEAARLTAGCTPGDVENVINTAFILYDQEASAPDRKPLEKREDLFGNLTELGFLCRNLREAVERFTVGDPHPSADDGSNTGKNDGGRFSVSVHEVGHALVDILDGRMPFEKITTLPRGDALGYVQPSRQRAPYTKADYEARIRCFMGGRAAEETVYGADQVSAGASSDLESATAWARMMVERLGFSDQIGFMTVNRTTARHLGASAYTCSESFRERSDQAVNELLKRLYQETRGLLAGKKEFIEFLAGEVVKRETMTGEEFMQAYRKAQAHFNNLTRKKISQGQS